MRACRDLGIASVAVYSDCDRGAPHVSVRRRGVSSRRESAGRELPAHRQADRRRAPIGRGRRSSRLRIPRGERRLRRSCAQAGLVFIGPSPEAIRLMGSKTLARQTAARAGVPTVPGTEDALDEALPEAEVARIAAEIGYPLMVKAVAGGGGKGMRLVSEPDDLAAALRAARSEAGSAFGESAVYLERRLERPRHIEIQLLADSHGTVIPFVERECSIQRRHQKVVEESPSPVMTADAARRDDGRGRSRRARGQLHQRRDDRVPRRRRRRGRQVLFPRNEHAAAGRASDHRDGDRHRPRRVADPHRARRAPDARPGAGRDARRPRHRVPHLRRGSGRALHAVARKDSASARAVRAGHPRRQRRDLRLRSADLLRLDDLEAGRVGRRSRSGDRRA